MKKDYMTRLERAARWRLPPQEADEVIADYRDIVGNPPRAEEELRRDVGDPEQVIKMLGSSPRAYRTWMVMFALMALCIFIPWESPLPMGSWFILDNLFSPYVYFFIPGFHMYLWFMIPALILSLVWFRPRKGEIKAPLPRSVIIILAAELALMGLVWWVFYQITLYPDGFLYQISRFPDWFRSITGQETLNGHHMLGALEWGGAAVGVTGLVGLVKARMRDRRWRAVYFMSLSLMMLAYCVLMIFYDMGPMADSWVFHRQCCLVITVLGLIGTGVALC